MIDQTERRIVEFTESLTFSDIGEASVEAAKLRLIDSIGVALAAGDAAPVAALRSMAPIVSDGRRARLWQTGLYTTPDHAALTNGTMIRYLDMSDAYTLVSTAHPSDNIAGLIALAESEGRSVADLILAVVVSYEIQCRFCDVAPFHQNGWDQPIVGAPAAAMGASKLLGLSARETRNALALAVTPNLPTYQTRRGELSMWKNIAGPNGAHLGIHAAMMAGAGITGPDAPFDGPNGLWQLTVGEAHALPLPTDIQGHVFAVTQSDIKLFPVRNACQLPVQLALELKSQIGGDDIVDMTVWTDEHAFGVPSKDPSLWNPTTRESADHSLPFCLAVAILDGHLDMATFSQSRFLDDDVHALMGRIKIAFDPEFNRLAPSYRACRLTAVDKGGRRYTAERIWSPDDPARLPDAKTVYAKFESLLAPGIHAGDAKHILGGLKDMAPSDSVAKIVDLLAHITTAGNPCAAND